MRNKCIKILLPELSLEFTSGAMQCDVIDIVTCDGAGRRSGVQGYVRLRGAMRRKAGHLLKFGHRHAVRPTFRRCRGDQQRLLGLNRSRRQMWGSDFLGHQLLFDLVDKNEVIQL